MTENRSLAYALADNIIGFDDGYESLGERAGAALRDDPMGVARTVGGAIYDSARDFGGRFVRDPAGAVVDTANELGLGYVEAGQRLAGGLGAYTDQGMSVDEARDAQLMDALTMSELLGGGVLANQLRRGVMPSVDVGDSGPADPSRREFLKQSAATAGVAAVAPDAVREVMDVMPTAARRAVGANPLGAAVSQISKLRKQADEMTEVAAGRGELPFGNRNEYRIAAFKKYDEMADTRSAALDALDADTLANASDADLDTFVREFYDYNLSGYDYLNAGDVEHPAYDALVIEMQKRGLHKQTDRKGLDKYPYARAMVEDYGIKTRKDGEFPRPADIDEETANKRILDAFSHAAELRDAELNAVRDNLPVTRVADYDNAVRDVKDVMLRLEGIQNKLKNPEVDPFSVIDEKMAAIDEAVPLLANNRGGVSLTNPRTEAMITPSMENPGKFRISYIDRKSGEPMGDTENFETMEAAIRDAMGQGYLTLGRFEPQNFAMGGGVGSLSREARDMFRGPRGIATLPRFAEGGFVSKQVENYVSPTVQGRLDEDIARLQGRIEEIESSEFFNRSKSLKQQGQRLISHLRDQIAGYEARKHTSNEVINQVVDSETGEVVGESLTSLAGAYSQALRNRGPNADLMSGFVESVQQIDPDMRVQIGGGATVADAFAARYGKPKVKQFMDATGADFRTAGTLLYGSGFNQYDPRDFTAIMSADDPLAAASAGTREALDAGISMLPGKRYRSYRGDDPRYDMIPNSQFGIYNPKDDSPYPIAQQEGVKLDYLGMTPDRITFNAQRFGLDLSNVDALRQAGVPDSTIMALQQSGNVRDFGVYGDQSYLRPNAEYFYNFAGNPVSFFAEGGAADMSEYRDALIASESSGDVGAENPSGAVGLTQAMPDTLEDFKDETGLDFTPEEYANSRELQTQFQDWYEQKTINYIMDKGLDRYIGQTIKGVPITMSSMLGMAHLGGDYGMRKFLETGGRYDPDDGYTKLSDYGRKFANMSIVGQGEVGYRPSPEEILMSMPVKQEAEFTDPRGYSPIPQLRPQYMATDPMPLPRLRPAPETLVEEEVEEALLQRERPTMVQKYGLPGDLPAGIGSLSQMAKNMYS